MTYKPDGGPAFPKDHTFGGNSGMSLRDWFAGQAIPSILCAKLPEQSQRGGASPQQLMAKTAYLMADAMLAERDK